MGANPLRELNRLGQSVWFDYIRRRELTSGHLQSLIDGDGLSGVTSNPTIFEKAIAGSDDYDAAIRKLAADGRDPKTIFESLAVDDIARAADLFRPTYQATEGRDGFVSIEVSPLLARDTGGTIREAQRLWREVGRPNILVKVPGTAEGLPAIEQLLSEGININVTLLFAIARYEEVANAYIKALEKLASAGKPINRLASVASFFVSRVDTAVDRELETRMATVKSPQEREHLAALQGKAAIANAKLAYAKFREIFSSPRFQALAEKGARAQRMLWASTGTKNPKYSDTLYVDPLIGPETVNTMPVATLDAFRDHGKPRLSIAEGWDEARAELKQLQDAGIDLAGITRKLEEEGVEAFAKDYEKLVATIEGKRAQFISAPGAEGASAGGTLDSSTHAALSRLTAQQFPRRLWERDPGAWKEEPAHQKIIRNALGWLTVPETMLSQVEELTGFAQEARRAGFTAQVLLGMGGSSLCPDVCRATFGAAPGFLPLHVLDSTVPSSVATLEKGLDLRHTLFLVSSKSGGTTETMSFFHYFYDRVRALKGDAAGENFVAITDPGSSLEKLARERKLRRVFPGQPDIGGRFSALSNFGMVPAALAGVDVRTLLERAVHMAQACGAAVPAEENPGLTLGATLAEAARRGRDKITFVISPAIATFADWVEQLVAESTGKEGKGLLPVAGESLGDPAAYGPDRVFVRIKLADDADDRTERALKSLEAAGHPVVRIVLRDRLDLGGEFFRWEVATAAAGALLGINPFDQPNVQESKDNTKSLLAEYRAQGKFPAEEPVLESNGFTLYADSGTKAALARGGVRSKAVEGVLGGFLGQARPGDYVALLAYLEPTPEHTAALEALRVEVRDSARLATTLGYGPRFLHSTGQLHKGGDNNGLFIQLTADDVQDLPVPGEAYTFSVLKTAQALGDMRSLVSKQRRVIRVHLGRDVRGQLARLQVVWLAAVKAHAPARAS